MFICKYTVHKHWPETVTNNIEDIFRNNESETLWHREKLAVDKSVNAILKRFLKYQVKQNIE